MKVYELEFFFYSVELESTASCKADVITYDQG